MKLNRTESMVFIQGRGDPFEGDIETTALQEAIVHGSGATGWNSENNDIIYDWIESFAKNSLCFSIADALRELGYKIIKAEEA
jgi:hypothetical protein